MTGLGLSGVKGQTVFHPYNEQTASVQDRIAWVLCQIIDDDAPVRWTRHRFAAECIARNEKLMIDLKILGEQKDDQGAR